MLRQQRFTGKNDKTLSHRQDKVTLSFYLRFYTTYGNTCKQFVPRAGENKLWYFPVSYLVYGEHAWNLNHII